MEFSEALSELWMLVGELLDVLIAELYPLAVRIERTPHFWTWIFVWLGLFWLCLRWINIAKDANERRIYDAAEARLSALMDEANAPLATDLEEVTSNDVSFADFEAVPTAHEVST